ncbi:nuclear transport factor 2 family protein [Alterisphingorhabdus coralli]|uniref:Nuclear transport factor 2 family protein n=1 Tax=Alterisphingorhabdus coralli TaxID=3071408 RepID=A0AA97F979_9SPHN|nr:nuclear transport factor 2 family protein [Parasphingorhabdus sp. SCSIO 66989]WOE75608.1 nuclear transport factor 2 family protein [Parasphingorhabdus sp. SCSIO 66989]
MMGGNNMAVVLFIGFSLAGFSHICTAADSQRDEGDMTPKQVVEKWIALFNAGDADGLAALYHDDAVNHQVTAEPVEGREAIRAMFAGEFAAADMHCIAEVIHEAGEVAVLEWRDPLGLRGCGFFTVRDGKIAFQRGYWDRLKFLKMHGLPIED